MGRLPRAQVVGGLYHVTARGNRRQPIFLGDRDRQRFLQTLGSVALRHDWRCHAYCLMHNHYHLVVETPMPDLSVGMHRLNSSYSHWFNRVYELDGHLFQGRFHSVLIESDWHLLELTRYVSMNPVHAGLCSAPGHWPWSSYRAVVGEAPVPTFLAVGRILGYFGRRPDEARRRLRRFVLDGANETPAP
jgi:putative transposase